MARFADVDEMSAAFVELEAIVRDLAALRSFRDDFGFAFECRCPTADHADGCPYRRARRWVSAHPVPTEPPPPEMCSCGHDLGWHSPLAQFDAIMSCDHGGCECDDFDRVSAHPVSGDR